MADLGITIPDSLNVPASEMSAFKKFLQQMTNRRGVGYLRYGLVLHRQGYMSRLESELKAYKRTGNREQLINIAVYAFLESYAPENEKHHFDNTVRSVTRKKD
jgi:hypothetical protein